MNDVLLAFGISAAAVGALLAGTGWIAAAVLLTVSDRLAHRVVGLALVVLPIWAVVFKFTLAEIRRDSAAAPYRAPVPAEVSP